MSSLPVLDMSGKPDGCRQCALGAKMVLFVTGICHYDCFYCPISAERRDRDVVFANERPVTTDQDLLDEATAMGALGTGITGGDPHYVLERTSHYIDVLKGHFGEEHHIHLYTSFPVAEADRHYLQRLDEIRFHPLRFDLNPFLDSIEWFQKHGVKIGVEVPLIPSERDALQRLVHHCNEVGVDFVTMNELEFSETNQDALRDHGDVPKDSSGTDHGAVGSAQLGLDLEGLDLDIVRHYCASSWKDRIQLGRRLKRRAQNTVRELELVTEDGTFVLGTIAASWEVIPDLRKQFRIPSELIEFSRERDRIELAAWVAEEIGPQLEWPTYLVEEYPTATRLELMSRPLNRAAQQVALEFRK